MANPTCTPALLINSAIAACFENFNRSERLSILVYLNALELAAIGGTNYNAQLGHNGALNLAAECYRKQLFGKNPVVIPSIPYLVIAFNAATNSGGAPASTKSALSAAIACNKDFTLQQKAAQALLLACLLGSHKSYPQ